METSAGGFPGLPPVANPEQRGLMLPSPIDVPKGQLSLTCVLGQTGTVSRCRFCRCVKLSQSRLKWAGTRRVWGQQLRPGRVPPAGGRRGPFPPAALEQGTEAPRRSECLLAKSRPVQCYWAHWRWYQCVSVGSHPRSRLISKFDCLFVCL